MPPLLVSHSGVVVSLPIAVAPPVAVAFTMLSEWSHCALAVALVEANACVEHESFDFASASPFCFAKALAMPRSVLQLALASLLLSEAPAVAMQSASVCANAVPFFNEVAFATPACPS